MTELIVDVWEWGRLVLEDTLKGIDPVNYGYRFRISRFCGSYSPLFRAANYRGGADRGLLAKGV